MSPVDRQKICPNCDGKISYDVAQCPFCFTGQQVDFTAPKALTPTSDPFATLYPPPYSSHSSQTEEGRSSFKTAIEPDNRTTDSGAIENTTASFWPILSLILGGHLLTIGILQFFFSDHGMLRLEMNASYWLLMVLIGLPLAYFGVKKLSDSQ